MATISDLVKYTGISKSTISRALSNQGSVSPQKQAIINQAIKELGYVPNYFASNLKSKNSKTIAFHINGTQNLFFDKLIETVQNNVEKEGYNLIITYGIKNFQKRICDLASLSPAALLFSPDKYDSSLENILSTNNIYALQLFSDTFPSLDSIVVDDNHGTYLAAKRLINSGSKNILLIGFEGHVFDNRVAGYRRALEENGMKIDERYIVKISGSERLSDVVMSTLLSLNPDSVIAIANTLGLEVQKAFTKMGKIIGQNVSLIQYDDSPTAELTNITVIGHTFESLGKMIASKVIEGIKAKRKEISKIKVEPILIERNSVINN